MLSEVKEVDERGCDLIWKLDCIVYSNVYAVFTD